MSRANGVSADERTRLRALCARLPAMLGRVAQQAIPALLDALEAVERELAEERERRACDEIASASVQATYRAEVSRLCEERDEARAEVLLARSGGVFAASARQGAREADAIQWGATVGERDALRAENAALRERVAVLEALVGIVP